MSLQLDQNAHHCLTLVCCRAHGHSFGLVLLHEAAGSLQQPHHMRQLELQLLQRRLTGAVQLQAGWQVHEGAGAASEASTDAQLKAVLLSAAEGQWPLLAVARHTRTGTPRAEAADAAAAEGVVATDGATDGCGGTAAAIDAAIQAPARLRRRLQAVAGTLAGAEPDFVLVRSQEACVVMTKLTSLCTYHQLLLQAAAGMLRSSTLLPLPTTRMHTHHTHTVHLHCTSPSVAGDGASVDAWWLSRLVCAG